MMSSIIKFIKGIKKMIHIISISYLYYMLLMLNIPIISNFLVFQSISRSTWSQMLQLTFAVVVIVVSWTCKPSCNLIMYFIVAFLLFYSPLFLFLYFAFALFINNAWLCFAYYDDCLTISRFHCEISWATWRMHNASAGRRNNCCCCCWHLQLKHAIICLIRRKWCWPAASRV